VLSNVAPTMLAILGIDPRKPAEMTAESLLSALHVSEKLVLVRHGQTVHNVAGIAQGWNDSALSDVGRDQVQRLAERLARPCTRRRSIHRRSAARLRPRKQSPLRPAWKSGSFPSCAR
jgi:hypothetical protein